MNLSGGDSEINGGNMRASSASHGKTVGLGRTARRAKAGIPAGPMARFTSPLLIIGFFCVLSIFDRPGQDLTFDTQLAFLINLVGMG